MPKLFGLALGILFTLSSTQVLGICQNWSRPQLTGVNDLEDASGLAPSKIFPGLLYMAQDEGMLEEIALIDHQANVVGSFDVTDKNALGYPDQFNKRDIEGIAVGPCSAGSCVFIANTDTDRDPVKAIVVFPESKSGKPKPIANIRVSQIFHGMSVDPRTGDIYLIKDSEIFRLLRSEWEGVMKEKKRATSLGSIAIRELQDSDQNTLIGRKTTGLAISPDGQSLLTLTKHNVFEIMLDLSQFDSVPKAATLPHIKIPIDDNAGGYSVSKPDGITYSLDGRSFYFISDNRGEETPLLRSDCN